MMYLRAVGGRFHANECVFCRNEQQKVYFQMITQAQKRPLLIFAVINKGAR